MISYKICFFQLDCYAFPLKACILNKLQLQCSPYQKIKGLAYMNAERFARLLMLQNFHISMF